MASWVWLVPSSIQVLYCGRVKNASAGSSPVKGKCLRQAARYAPFKLPKPSPSSTSAQPSQVSTPPAAVTSKGRSLHR